MAFTDTVLATDPLKYWPLNETSGTSAAELVDSGTATAVGLTMGNADGPTGGTLTDAGGIGGKAVAFTGTEHITLAADKILGGKAEWTVSAWIYTALADSLEHVFYGEMSTSAGNDQIRCGMKGPAAGPVMSHTYGNDPSIVTKLSNSVYLQGYWALVHFIWRTGGGVEMWFNGGRRSAQTGSSSGVAWTDSSLASWIGKPPRAATASGWVGRVAHVFIHDRALTGPEMSGLYRAGTPLQRTLLAKAPLFKSTAVWNQPLTTPGNEPTIASDSAATVQKLVNQVGSYGAALSVGGGPIFCVTNAQATQRVRNVGGPNTATLYADFAEVPLPAEFTFGIGNDSEATVYNTDTDEAWDFFVIKKALIAVDYLTTSGALVGGAIPVNVTPYAYVVYPADSSHAIGPGKSVAVTITTGNQRAGISWGITDGATYYRIYRRLNTPGSSGGNLMIEVSAATHTWIDDGSITPGVSNTAAAAAVTTDWGAWYGGYIADTDLNSGVYEPPDQLFGASATSLPLYGGVVTIEEAYAGVIPHALTMAVVDNAEHVYPAQRHDSFFGPNNIKEGTRFQLDPTYDITQISNLFVRACAKAAQDYGAYVRDHGGAIVIYTEGAEKLGRDPYPEVLAGSYNYEVLAGFPWSRMRAIDPTWTIAQLTPPPDVTTPIGTLSDDFAGGSIDTAKWTAAGSPPPTQSAGKLVIPTHDSPYAKVTTAGGPYSLVDSEVYFKTLQLPLGDTADQSGLTLACDVDPANAIIQFWIDSGFTLKVQYKTVAGDTVTLAPTTWDPVMHAWRRVRESAGTVYAETSVDGVTWQTFASFTWASTGWPSTALQALNALLFAGNYNGVAGRADMLVESFNVIEVPAVPVTPDDFVYIVSHTLRNPPWPSATIIGAWRASAWATPPSTPAGAPVTSAPVTPTSTGTEVTFAGLQANVSYVAYAGGRGVRFLVPPPISEEFIGARSGQTQLEVLEARLTAFMTDQGYDPS